MRASVLSSLVLAGLPAAGCSPPSQSIGDTLTLSPGPGELQSGGADAGGWSAATGAESVGAVTEGLATESAVTEVVETAGPGTLNEGDQVLLRTFTNRCYFSVAVDAQDDIYLAGRAFDLAEAPGCNGTCWPSVMVARKLDRFGVDLVELEDPLDTPRSDSFGDAIVLLDEGGFLVAGERIELGSSPLLQAYDAAGTLLWHASDQVPGIPSRHSDAARRPAGDLVIARTDALLRYSAQGELLGEYVKTTSVFTAIAADAAGGFAVLATQKIRRFGPEGDLVWDDGINESSALEDLAFTSAGELVVVGSTHHPASKIRTPWVRKYDAAGALLWQSDGDPGPSDSQEELEPNFRAVAALADGRVAAVGNVYGQDGTGVVRLYAADGEALGVRPFDHPEASLEGHVDLALTSAGSLIVTGCMGDHGYLVREAL